jgi:tetratricopeptide (TPR) repeat protein
MKKWILCAFILFLISACGHLSSQSDISVIEYPPELKEAQYFLSNKNPERAEGEVLRYLGTTRDVYWHGQAQLMLGEIREAMGQESQALETYKQAIKHGAGYNSTITAQGLYRMSWIYERTLQYKDLQITLLDLLHVLGSGDNFIKHIETPARLANTYYVLGQWERALEQRDKITKDTFNKYKTQAKDEKNLFQARLYMAFQGMQPVSTTPHKSQQIITNSRQELLEVAEMGTEALAERAVDVLRHEYQRYFSQLKAPRLGKSPEETLANNRQQISELSTFVDEVNELRVLRRPPELIVNKKLNVDFFRELQAMEQEARQIVHGLSYGIQKIQKSKKN